MSSAKRTLGEAKNCISGSIAMMNLKQVPEDRERRSLLQEREGSWEATSKQGVGAISLAEL